MCYGGDVEGFIELTIQQAVSVQVKPYGSCQRTFS